MAVSINGSGTITGVGNIESVPAADVDFTPSGNISSTTVQGALNDIAGNSGASKIGYLPAGTGAVATTVQGKLRDTVSIKDFGGVCDGLADDTEALRKAIAYSNSKSVKITIPGRIKITDEIALERAFWIESEGDSADITAKSSVIFFDNSDVDGSGNATKCLFRFKNTYPYALYGSKLKNVSVVHVNKTIKNQHTIIFDTTYIVDLFFENITVTDATGYVVYLVGNGVTNYYPGFHNPYFLGVRGRNVGGLIGQASSAKTWIAAGDFSMLNVERAINPVSPGAVLCDFSGARASTIRNPILEGVGISTPWTVFKFTSRDNIVETPWIEFPTNSPTYDFDTVDALEIRKYTGAGKIKATGEAAVVRVTGVTELNTTSQKFELQKGATVDCSESYSAFYYNADRPHVLPSQAGKIKYRNQRTASGGAYSHDYFLELLKLDKAKALNVSDNNLVPINSHVKFGRSIGGITFSCVPALDATEGRILQFTSTSGVYDVPFVKFEVTIPTEFVGCSVVLGIRYSVQTSDTTTVVEVPAYASGAANNVTASNLANATKINTITAPADYGKYKNAYVVVNESTGNVVFNLVARDTTAALTVNVADIQIYVGSNLPSLRAYNSDPATWRASAMPTSGYFVAGDVVFNTDTAVNTSGWRRKTTGTGNVLGTDWIAF